MVRDRVEKRNKRRVLRPFKIGQKVLLRNPSTKKLDPRFTGPFSVKNASENSNVVTIENERFSSTVHQNNIIPFEEGQDVEPSTHEHVNN